MGKGYGTYENYEKLMKYKNGVSDTYLYIKFSHDELYQTSVKYFTHNFDNNTYDNEMKKIEKEKIINNRESCNGGIKYLIERLLVYYRYLKVDIFNI